MASFHKSYPLYSRAMLTATRVLSRQTAEIAHHFGADRLIIPIPRFSFIPGRSRFNFPELQETHLALSDKKVSLLFEFERPPKSYEGRHLKPIIRRAEQVGSKGIICSDIPFISSIRRITSLPIIFRVSPSDLREEALGLLSDLNASEIILPGMLNPDEILRARRCLESASGKNRGPSISISVSSRLRFTSANISRLPPELILSFSLGKGAHRGTLYSEPKRLGYYSSPYSARDLQKQLHKLSLLSIVADMECDDLLTTALSSRALSRIGAGGSKRRESDRQIWKEMQRGMLSFPGAPLPTSSDADTAEPAGPSAHQLKGEESRRRRTKESRRRLVGSVLTYNAELGTVRILALKDLRQGKEVVFHTKESDRRVKITQMISEGGDFLDKAAGGKGIIVRIPVEERFERLDLVSAT